MPTIQRSATVTTETTHTVTLTREDLINALPSKLRKLAQAEGARLMAISASDGLIDTSSEVKSIIVTITSTGARTR